MSSLRAPPKYKPVYTFTSTMTPPGDGRQPASSGTTTPFAYTTLPTTPGEYVYDNPSKSNATITELNRRLQTLACDGQKAPEAQAATDLTPDLKLKDVDLQCAFGFSGPIDEPQPVPETKIAFLSALEEEIELVSGLQEGLASYHIAINSHEYHTFSAEFRKQETTAINETIRQLNQVAVYLKGLGKNYKTQDGDKEVEKHLVEGFECVRPFVMRVRSILRHSHVFYKINFVSVAKKH